MEIKKKSWPELFEDISSGKKNFELRLADWECKEGDVLILQEWDPETKNYTGREIRKIVKCVLKTKDLKFFSEEEVDKYGWQVIGF